MEISLPKRLLSLSNLFDEITEYNTVIFKENQLIYLYRSKLYLIEISNYHDTTSSVPITRILYEEVSNIYEEISGNMYFISNRGLLHLITVDFVPALLEIVCNLNGAKEEISEEKIHKSCLAVHEAIGLATVITESKLILYTFDPPINNNSKIKCSLKGMRKYSISCNFNIDQCTIWSLSPIHCIVVGYGYGPGIVVWRIDLHPKTNVWSIFSMLWKVGIPGNYFCQEKVGWTTALLRDHNTYLLTGDSTGALVFWSRDNNKLLIKLWEEIEFSDFPITLLYNIPGNELLWIGDAGGTLFLTSININESSVTRIQLINIHSNAAITSIYWMSSPSLTSVVNLTDLASSINLGILRTVSGYDGVIWETEIYNCIESTFQSSIDSYEKELHHFVVEVCAFLPDLNILITSSSDTLITMWDVTTGQLIHYLESDHSSCTQMAAFEHRNSSRGSIPTATLICGYRSGRIVYYNICNNDSEGPESSTPLTPIEGRNTVTSLDILDELDVISMSTNSLSLLSIAVPAPILPYDTNRSTEREKDSKWLLKCIGSHQLCPLTVTDIFYSSYGQYTAVCYGRSNVIVFGDQSCSKAILQFQLESQEIIDISAVKSISEDLSEKEQAADNLLLVLLGQSTVKVLNAVTGKLMCRMLLDSVVGLHNRVISEYNIPSSSSSAFTRIPYIVSNCSAWLLPPLTGEKSLRYHFLCTSIDGFVFSLDSSGGSSLVSRIHQITISPQHQHQHRTNSKYSFNSTDVDNTIAGIQLFGAGYPNMAYNWSRRALLVSKFDLSSEFMSVLKSSSYIIKDNKSRIIKAFALKSELRDRLLRILLVLSDGTVFILHT